MEQRCIYCKDKENELIHLKLEYKTLNDKYKKRFDVLGCEKKISFGSMAGKTKKRMDSFNIKINQNETNKQHFNEVKNWVNQLKPLTTFKVKELIQEFETKSLGDLQRRILDYFVCTGQLIKIKFSMGKSGHNFQKPETPVKCPYFIKNENGKEMCGCNTWIVLGKKVEKG